jgi:phage gp46-like protein
MDLALSWNPTIGAFDLSVAEGDLAADDGLRTAVIVSLFTDRLAAPDDPLPTSDGDRRGWWGDTNPPGRPRGDLIGSKLWLLKRAKATEQTRQRAMAYAREVLAWMITDGVAAKVDVAAGWRGLDGLELRIRISRQNAAGQVVEHVFDLFWSVELGR